MSSTTSTDVRVMEYGQNAHVKIAIETKKDESRLHSMTFNHLHPMTGGKSLEGKDVKQVLSELRSCHKTMAALDKMDVMRDMIKPPESRQVQVNAHLHLEQCRDEAQCIRNSLLNQLKEDPSAKGLLEDITGLGALCQASLPEHDLLFLNVVKHVPSQLVQILNKYKLLDGRNHILEESHSTNTFKCKISNIQIWNSKDLVAVNFSKGGAGEGYIFEDGCLISFDGSTRMPRDDMQEKIIDAITAILKGTAPINSLPKVV